MKPYIIEHSELMNEWDWEKNNALGFCPDKLTLGSGIKVWWRCANGHSWDAIISSRAKGSGCRFCAGQAVTSERSLAATFPELLYEWDYKKNYPLTPNDVSFGSNKKVYWICPTCNQSYQMSISNRTSPLKQKSDKSKCPICLNKIIIKGYNSLKAKYPEIVAQEWDYTKNSVDPDTIAPQTNKKYWWICNNGHSYETQCNNKIGKNGGECPYCSGRKVSNLNRLSDVNPDLAKEWHPTKNKLKPSEVSFGSNKDAWWLCPICSHEWKAKINNRSKGKGCPNCSKGQHTSFPEQAIFFYIKQLFPSAINQYKVQKTEIDIFIPEHNIGIEYDGGYYHRKQTKYTKDVEKNILLYNNNISLIRVRESDCHPMSEDFCKIISVTYTPDYSFLKQVIVAIINYISIKTNMALSIDINIDDVKNELIKETRTVKYEDSFAAYLQKYPEKINAIWDVNKNYPITPEMVTAKSNKRLNWICPNNSKHMWEAPVSSISAGYGCRRCAKKYQYTTEEWIEKALEAHNGKYDYSKVIYVNSDTKVIITCPIHGDFSQNPSEHLAGKGCSWCAGQGGFHPLNRLSVARPDLALEWDYDHPGNKGLTPDDVVINDSINEYWWKCNNGKPHSYHAKISARISRNLGCAVCHGKQISSDTCLAFLRPDLLEEWHSSNVIKPTEVSIGSEQRVVWKCKNPDHPAYESSVISRVKSKYGCRYCSGDKKDHNTFCKQVYDKFPHIELSTKYEKSSAKIMSRCKICGTERVIEAGKLLSGRMGCKKCGK